MTPLGYSKYSLIRHLTLGWISTQITTWEPLDGGGVLGALVWLGCLSLTSRATLDALRFKAGCSRADPGDSPLFSLCFLLPTPCSDISDTSHAEKAPNSPKFLQGGMCCRLVGSSERRIGHGIQRGMLEPLEWREKLEPGGKSMGRNVTPKIHEEGVSINTEGGNLSN